MLGIFLKALNHGLYKGFLKSYSHILSHVNNFFSHAFKRRDLGQ